jgi:ligand-binding sensor domain-containing protein
MRITILFTLLLWFSQRLSAQSSDSLVHYSIDNGLTTNIINRVLEDSKGFIWIMTNNRGVSRFDGKRFRNFTTADGLPLNNIFLMGEDSHQRVWLSSMIKSFMYFSLKDNKFYTIPNNTEGSKVGFFNYIYEMANGHLIFQSSNNFIFELDENLKVLSCKKNELRGAVTTKNFPSINPNFSLLKHTKDSIFSHLKGENLPPIITHYPTGFAISRVYTDSVFMYLKGTNIVSYVNKTEIEKNINELSNFKNTLNIQILNTGLPNRILIKTDKDFFIVDERLNRLKEFDFINKYAVNTVSFDSKGNFWVATEDDGVYVRFKQRKQSIKPIFLKDQTIESVVSDNKGYAFFGITSGELFVLKDSIIRKLNIENAPHSNITALSMTSQGNLFVAWEDIGYTIIPSNLLYKSTPISVYPESDLRQENRGKPFFKYSKYLFKTNAIGLVQSGNVRAHSQDADGNIIISTAEQDIRTLKDSANFWTNNLLLEKTAAVSLSKGADNGIWLFLTSGTLFLKNNKIDSLLAMRKEIPFLEKTLYPSITDSDNNIWTAKGRFGLYCFNPSKSKLFIIEETTRDFIADIVLDNKNRKWIATNNGVVLVEVLSQNPFKYRFRRFDKSNNIPSNEVTSVSVSNDKLYVGTIKGLSVFDLSTILLETKPPKSDIPLHFSNLKINQKDTILRGSYDLRYDENNLEIDFAGLNFDPQNPIRYEYRMQKEGETEVDWRTTNEPHLVFSFLPAGKYTLNVRAFDAENHILEIEQPLVFNVRLPFWKTGWFLGSIFAFLGLGTWFLYQNNIKRIQKEEAEKAEISKQFTVLELQALQAQMNPHFVFNALTAIQNFIWNKDVKAANEYLTEFSTLMRLFLESSRRKYLTVEEEVKLLKIYTHLEQLRFPDRFDVDFDIDENINPSDELPSMLIQPFVENAINHGLLYKKDKGLLQVHFSKENNILTCVVEDNGVGRDAAAVKQAKSMKAHKSRATGILQERIALMKSVENMEVKVNIEDKNFENLQDFGTKVLIEIKEL